MFNALTQWDQWVPPATLWIFTGNPSPYDLPALFTRTGLGVGDLRVNPLFARAILFRNFPGFPRGVNLSALRASAVYFFITSRTAPI